MWRQGRAEQPPVRTGGRESVSWPEYLLFARKNGHVSRRSRKYCDPRGSGRSAVVKVNMNPRRKSRPPEADALHAQLVANYLRVLDYLVAFGFTERQISLGLDRGPEYVKNSRKQINAPRADTIFLFHERFFVNPYAFLNETATVILDEKQLREKLAGLKKTRTQPSG
jgi:hypothetical protein